jgi:hypothetical protein
MGRLGLGLRKVGLGVSTEEGNGEAMVVDKHG